MCASGHPKITFLHPSKLLLQKKKIENKIEKISTKMTDIKKIVISAPVVSYSNKKHKGKFMNEKKKIMFVTLIIFPFQLLSVLR